jgi:hypothetical protein
MPHVVPPDDLPGFPMARRSRPETPRRGGGLRARWKDDQKYIYEWDYQHGEVELYDPRGNHLGGFDPRNGARIRAADSGRRVTP